MAEDLLCGVIMPQFVMNQGYSLQNRLLLFHLGVLCCQGHPEEEEAGCEDVTETGPLSGHTVWSQHEPALTLRVRRQQPGIKRSSSSPTNDVR